MSEVEGEFSDGSVKGIATDKELIKVKYPCG